MADNVDYLGYAQAMNQLNPYAALGQQIGGTLSDIAMQRRTEREAAPKRELADIQLQQARAGLEEDIAKRAAMQQVQGAPDLTGAYAAQMRKAQRAEQTKSFTEGFDKLVASKSSPEALKRYTQAALSKDPDLATWAPYISYVDEGSIKITKPFGPNEAPDPTRPGSFLPPGVYTVTGSRTNDPTNPFAFQLIEPAKAEKAEETWGEPYAMSVGGKKAMVQKSSRGQIRPVVQDVSTTVKVSTGGGVSKPAKALPASQVEALADMKAVKDTLAEAQEMAGNIGGPVAGRLQRVGQYVGLSSEDFNELDQKLNTVNNIMLKLRSGAAVTPSEYTRFMREYPQATDNPDVRKTKFVNTINYATGLINEKLDAYEESGYKVPRKTIGGGGAGAPGAPPAAIDMLKKNPSLRGKFDEKYGKGASAKVLGR